MSILFVRGLRVLHALICLGYGNISSYLVQLHTYCVPALFSLYLDCAPGARVSSLGTLSQFAFLPRSTSLEHALIIAYSHHPLTPEVLALTHPHS